MSQPAKHFYEFGPFRLAPAERLLLRQGQAVPLTPKSFDLLVVLVEHQGHMLSKEALMQTVWPESYVEEGNLTRNVSTLRRALGDGEGEQRYIETVPRHGYRFAAEVKESWDEEAELAVQERISARVMIEEEEGGSTPDQAKAGIAAPQTDRITRLSWQMVTAGVVLVGLIVGVAYWWKVSRAQPAELQAAVRSLAVLPFKPLNPNDGDEYLGLGMADTLITRLSSLRPLVVRPTSAVLKYSGPTQDPLAAGREQRVDAVLDASLQRDGEHVRVTVRLLSVRDGAALWAYQCEEVQCNSLFAMQDVISERIAAALMPRLTGEERRRLRKHDTENKEAQLAYATGIFFWNKRTREGMKKGVEYFEQAIAKDPNYAMAYVGLADSYSLLANYQQCPSMECYPKAKVAVLRALEIDDELAQAHASLAQILHRYEWKWEEAEKEFKRATGLNPGYEYAHQWYGVYLCSLGRFEEAEAELRQALDLNPVSLGSNLAYSAPFFLSRNYDQAIAIYRKTQELDPNWYLVHEYLGSAYEIKGMYDQAIDEYLAAQTLSGTSPEVIAELKNAYAVSGIKGYWQKMSPLPKGKVPRERYHYAAAACYARFGWKEEAFYALEQAIKYRDDALVNLKVDPLFDGLRSDPRFAELLRRVGLAP